jgi:hypothetical protein
LIRRSLNFLLLAGIVEFLGFTYVKSQNIADFGYDYGAQIFLKALYQDMVKYKALHGEWPKKQQLACPEHVMCNGEELSSDMTSNYWSNCTLTMTIPSQGIAATIPGRQQDQHGRFYIIVLTADGHVSSDATPPP